MMTSTMSLAWIQTSAINKPTNYPRDPLLQLTSNTSPSTFFTSTCLMKKSSFIDKHVRMYRIAASFSHVYSLFSNAATRYVCSPRSNQYFTLHPCSWICDVNSSTTYPSTAGYTTCMLASSCCSSLIAALNCFTVYWLVWFILYSGIAPTLV